MCVHTSDFFTDNILPASYISAVFQDNTEDYGVFFFSEWQHPNKRQVLLYEIKLIVNNVVQFEDKVTNTNASFNITERIDIRNYTFQINTISLCGTQALSEKYGSFSGTVAIVCIHTLYYLK